MATRILPSRVKVTGAMTTERKLVTVLFADVIGSTALSERLDPERLRSVLDDYFTAMASAVERWGATTPRGRRTGFFA
jgi:class 3 adenylate cyclase